MPSTLHESNASVLTGWPFQPWARPWTDLGLGMCLWDSDGQLAETAESNSTLWQQLIRHADTFFAVTARAARDALSGNMVSIPLDPGGAAHVIAIPFDCRERTVCVVTAAVPGRGLHQDEDRVRFCNLVRIDAELGRRLAADLPGYTERQLAGLRDALHQCLKTSSEDQLIQRDVNELSTHLAQAYEELNLIYRISADLTVSKAPAEHFTELGEQLAYATVVKGFATVLEPTPGLNADPVVVTGGNVPITHDEVLKLYGQADTLQDEDAPKLIVINDLANRPEFGWIADRVGQFACFPLIRKERDFGAILAINREDGKDLCSEEIRLINSVVERGAAFLESAQLYDDLEQLFMGMLHALVSSIDAKDPYTCGHSQRVAWLSRHIGKLLGMSDEECQRIYLSGLLHDIGKIGVPEAVLCKNGRLTPEEFDEIKRHPEIGAHILEGVRQVDDLIPGVLYHHERYGGGGYPTGRAGEAIPLLGRIICLADSFDAMTTNRTYRTAQKPTEAAQEIERCSGVQFDPRIVSCFLGQDYDLVHEEMRKAGESFIGSSRRPADPGGQEKG